MKRTKIRTKILTEVLYLYIFLLLSVLLILSKAAMAYTPGFDDQPADKKINYVLSAEGDCTNGDQKEIFISSASNNNVNYRSSGAVRCIIESFDFSSAAETSIYEAAIAANPDIMNTRLYPGRETLKRYIYSKTQIEVDIEGAILNYNPNTKEFTTAGTNPTKFTTDYLL